MVTELRLFVREPLAVIWGMAFPVVLLVIIGLTSGSTGSKDLGGLRLIDVYTPIAIAFVIAVLALNGVPAVLAGYRENGILKRMALTPAGAGRVLGAELGVDGGVAVVTGALLVAVARVGFGVPLPRQAVGFVLAGILMVVALLAIGLMIAAVAPTARAANAAGAITFFPFMFFAGLWIPRPLMPALLRGISDWTPLGAAVESLQRASAGAWPHPLALVVLAAYAAAAGFLATRFFRWT